MALLPQRRSVSLPTLTSEHRPWSSTSPQNGPQSLSQQHASKKASSTALSDTIVMPSEKPSLLLRATPQVLVKPRVLVDAHGLPDRPSERIWSPPEKIGVYMPGEGLFVLLPGRAFSGRQSAHYSAPCFTGLQECPICGVSRRNHFALRADNWDWCGNPEQTSDWRSGVKFVREQSILQEPVLVADLGITSLPNFRRGLQLCALRDAALGGDYGSLLAQLTKARAVGVEQHHLVRFRQKLKDLQKQGLHISEGCDKDTLHRRMQWPDVTSPSCPRDVSHLCDANADCLCDTAEADLMGDMQLEISSGVVQSLLQHLGEKADKVLFEDLVNAAMCAGDGCVWKAGGKFIFSASDRNQSLRALLTMLGNHGKWQCAKSIAMLAKYSEKKYRGYVTAVQINFHFDGETYHEQHRDIYSAKQRAGAGANCTCSFRTAIGTICYSLGSSRIVQLSTMTDDRSAFKACCPRCTGKTELRWMHSGDSMYFNDGWNNSHTHGIPIMSEQCGPRISIAMLLGSEEMAKR